MASLAYKNGGLYNGAAAYDIFSGETAVRRPERPDRLPQDRPSARPKTRARLEVSPFALAGILAVALTMVLVIFSYERLYAATTQASNLRSQLSDLQQEQTLLRGKYEGMINFREIEQAATTRLGMAKPTGGQTVYVNLTGADRAEVLGGAKVTIFERAAKLVRDAFAHLAEYLS